MTSPIPNNWNIFAFLDIVAVTQEYAFTSILKVQSSVYTLGISSETWAAYALDYLFLALLVLVLKCWLGSPPL